MEVTDTKHLAYSLTGVPNSQQTLKPFDVLRAAEEALDEVRGCIARAKGKTKGLKISNKDPAPKSEAVQACSGKRKAKEVEKIGAKKRRAIAKAEALNNEEEFIEQLLIQWPICKQGSHGGVHCFVSESGLHILLTHEATYAWAMANRENPSKVTLDTPPNHKLFQPNLLGVKPVTRIPPKSNKSKDIASKQQTKVEGMPHNGVDWMGEGSSATNPICLDSDGPVAGPSKGSKLKREPSCVVISSGSCSVNDSKLSTRLPSPDELIKLIVAPIGVLLRGIDADYPNLHILDFAPHLRAYGIECIDQVPEYSVNWIVDNIHIPLREAALIHSSALRYLRK